ncbi:MAG: hypothetical protein OXG60_09275 [Chloroflexi bacterium]|nr:hypothetical protein [Chloroflexota bacterium]
MSDEFDIEARAVDGPADIDAFFGGQYDPDQTTAIVQVDSRFFVELLERVGRRGEFYGQIRHDGKEFIFWLLAQARMTDECDTWRE